MNLDHILEKRFSGKRVAIIGAGKEGVAVAEFLLKYGAKIDIRDNDENAECRMQNAELRNIRLIVGDEYLNGLNEVDIIVRSPGVPYLTPEIQSAKKNGVEVTSQTELFLQYCAHQTIAVTGTKGKSTTSALINQLLLDGGKRVRYGGNIGEPFINWLSDISRKEAAVLELSSFQLQGVSVSPRIAIVTGITEEHLDHHRNLDEYVEAKSNIVCHQRRSDVAILNADSLVSVKFAILTRAHKYWFSTKKYADPGVFVKKYDDGDWVEKSGLIVNKKIIKVSDIKLQGEHNLSNICAAVAVSVLEHVSFKSIANTLKEFNGLPHRLNNLGTYRGRIWIDDSFATAPDSTVAALKHYSHANPLLIVGGSSKGYGFDKLASEILKSRISRVILIGETASEIEKSIILLAKQRSINAPIMYSRGMNNMEDIISSATEQTKEGDTILFSPGCASFGLFKNVYDRAEQFEQTIRKSKIPPAIASKALRAGKNQKSKIMDDLL